MQQRQANLVSGRYCLFNQSDLDTREIVDIGIVVAHNGVNHWTATKPLHTPAIVAMRNHQVYHSAVLLRYMLRRTITSHLTPQQNEAWHTINDAVLHNMEAFAPPHISMRHEYSGGIVEQITRNQPPRPPHLDNLPASQTPRQPVSTSSSTATATATQAQQVPTSQGSSSTSTSTQSQGTTTRQKKPPKIHPCTQCSMTFLRTDHLRQHVATLHSGQKFKCMHCDKEFAYKRGMKAHIALQHTPTSGTHTCTESGCGYVTNTRGLFDHHMETKHQNLHIPCDICGKICTSHYAVREHQKRGKDCADTVKWHCPKPGCGAKCRTRRTQRSHVRQHHRELLADLDSPSPSMDEDASPTSTPSKHKKKKRKRTFTTKPPTGRKPSRTTPKQSTSTVTTQSTVQDDTSANPQASPVATLIEDIPLPNLDPKEPVTTIDLATLCDETIGQPTSDASGPMIDTHASQVEELIAYVHTLTAPSNTTTTPEATSQEPQQTVTSIIDEQLVLEQTLINEGQRLDNIVQTQAQQTKAQEEEAQRQKAIAEEEALAKAAREAGIRLAAEHEARKIADQEARKQEEMKRKERTKKRKAKEAAARAAYQKTLFDPVDPPFTPVSRTSSQTSSQTSLTSLTTSQMTDDSSIQSETSAKDPKQLESDRKKEVIRKTHEKFLADTARQKAIEQQQRIEKQQQKAQEQTQRKEFERMRQQAKEQELMKHKEYLQAQATKKSTKRRQSKYVPPRRHSSPGTATSQSSVTSFTSLSAPHSPTEPLSASSSVAEFTAQPPTDMMIQQTEPQDKRRASSQHQDTPPPKAILLTEQQKDDLGIPSAEAAIITSDDVHRKVVQRSSPETHPRPQSSTVQPSSSSASPQTGNRQAPEMTPQRKRAKTNWQKAKSILTSVKCSICGQTFHAPNKKLKLQRHIQEKHGSTEI